GDRLGDAALTADADKIAAAIGKKDFKGASDIAKKLAVKPGAAAGMGKLPKPFKDDAMLEYAMSPFRNKGVGGMNLQQDIPDWTKNKEPRKIEPAELEMVAVRSAIINEFGLHYPNQKAAVNAANKK